MRPAGDAADPVTDRYAPLNPAGSAKGLARGIVARGNAHERFLVERGGCRRSAPQAAARPPGRRSRPRCNGVADVVLDLGVAAITGARSPTCCSTSTAAPSAA